MIPRTFTLIVLLWSAIGAAAETPPLHLTGELTNTTQGASATLRLELVLAEDNALNGHLEIDAPLAADRCELEGRRHGAWLEFAISLPENTRMIFRGVRDASGTIKGTFIRGGGGQVVQFGHFTANPPSDKTAAPATPLRR